jgi:hypothetical protein
MTAGGYIAREAAVSAIINGAISAAFFFLIHGGADAVPFRGPDGLVLDALPQSFMVAFMGTLVPGLLARRAMAAGKLGPDLGIEAASIIRLAVISALLCAVAGVALVLAIALLAGSPGVQAEAAAPAKIAYGAVLGALVTTVALRRLLR